MLARSLKEGSELLEQVAVSPLVEASFASAVNRRSPQPWVLELGVRGALREDPLGVAHYHIQLPHVEGWLVLALLLQRVLLQLVLPEIEAQKVSYIYYGDSS